ncbi:MAG: sulfatase-like hydrolase/transferase [Opitutales bacterium]|nr:sulfatase-like hydrolase/transferase [Opitutales bacterium]
MYSLSPFFIYFFTHFLRTQEHPNILIIFTNEQGYGDVGCYGNENLYTPRFDQLAKERPRFTNFYAQPICDP